MNPSLATAATIMIAATMIASSDASATARAGSPPAAISGKIVAAIIGPSEESGPSTKIRDGPNTAYPSQAQNRRIQPGNRRQPRQLRIRHPLRHQQRSQHNTRDDILDQPPALVRPDRLQAGHCTEH